MPHKIFNSATSFRLLTTALMLSLASCAIAAEDTISTDRPGYVESSTVMPVGQFQVETSLAVEKDQQSPFKMRTTSTPTLLRYGVNQQLELRLESDGRIIDHTKNTQTGARSTDTGFADASIGLKWHVAEADKQMPSIGILLDATLDSGSKAVRGNGTRPSLRVIGEWELPAEFSLGVMPGLTYDKTQQGHRFAAPSLGVALTHNETEKLRTFVEVAMPEIAHQRNGGTVASFDFGAAYVLNRSCQIDAQFSRGLNHNTPDTAFAVGLSFKM